MNIRFTLLKLSAIVGLGVISVKGFDSFSFQPVLWVLILVVWLIPSNKVNWGKSKNS